MINHHGYEKKLFLSGQISFSGYENGVILLAELK